MVSAVSQAPAAVDGRINASPQALRAFTDGMPPPKLSSPTDLLTRPSHALGVDHFEKSDPTFRYTTNQAQVYIEGPEIFPAMEDMLSRATSSIRVDYYIFSGSQAQRLADILVQRAKAGVDVRVLLDPHHGEIPLFSESENAIIDYLKANGVQVQDYPLDSIVPPRKEHEHIDHDKVVIVDGQRAMVGGQNIGDPFLHNHDVMVQFAGPAVIALKRQFDQAWGITQPQSYPPDDLPALPAQGDSQIRVVGTGIGDRRTAQAVLTEGVRNATRRVYVEVFELTSPELIDELIAARQRGVDVRVLTDPGDPARFLGFPLPTGYPDLPSLYKLAGAGIQVRWYDLKPGQVQDHLKMAILDDSLVVGSANWTDSALESNAETSLQIKGGTAFNRLLHMFADDWNNNSQPIPKPTLYRRGLQTLINWVY